MKFNFQELLKSKTFYLCCGVILAAAAGYLTGTVTPLQAVGAALTGLAGICLRDAGVTNLNAIIAEINKPKT